MVVVGIGGGRIDHELANLTVAASVARRGVAVEVLRGNGRLVPVIDHLQLTTVPGEVVSLIPLLGDADGVVTEGLRYRLAGETLPAGSARGVSNEAVGERASVAVRSGLVLVVQPDWLASGHP
jgi:thiamine pyrophosphokinase